MWPRRSVGPLSCWHEASGSRPQHRRSLGRRVRFDWWRRLRERVRKLDHGVAGLAVEMGAEIDEVCPIPLDWCLAMLAQVLKQLERRGRPATLWSCASWLSGGAWLATNTSPLPNSALIARLLWNATTNGPMMVT